MKTIAVLALAAAALVSCQQQQNQGTPDNTTKDVPVVETSKK
jgi:hypothetical protein